MPFIERIGLGDGDGNLSFNKSVTVAMLTLLVTAVLTGRGLTWPVVTFGTTIIGAGFGLKAFMAVVARQTTMITGTDSLAITGNAEKMIAAIKQRRDPTLGVEDSGRVPQVHHD